MIYMQEKTFTRKLLIRLPNDLLSCHDVQTITSARLQVVARPDPVQRRHSLGLNEADIILYTCPYLGVASHTFVFEACWEISFETGSPHLCRELM